MDRGMDTAMMQVLRQLPRNRRMSAAVRQAAIKASRTTPLMAARTKPDLIEQRGDLEVFRQNLCGGRQLIEYSADDIQSG